MPVTPFHFGPGAALQAVAPKHISFIAFCTANVLIDIESLYNLVQHRYPVHAFFHTYVGATIMAMVVTGLFWCCRWLAARYGLPDLFNWRQLRMRQVATGALLGAWSHVVFDGIMHYDVRPFWPFSDVNPFLDFVPLWALHLGCALAGLIGLLVAVGRWYIYGDKSLLD
ncbi:MAG: metal-dependent hydrolase [Rhodocyclaceae bacterium]